MAESLPKASPYTEYLRDRLVAVTLEWESVFGVAPSITSAVSEYDAACLVGHTDESYGKVCAGRTAVTRGCDFTFNGLRYQVKANRPSGPSAAPPAFSSRSALTSVSCVDSICEITRLVSSAAANCTAS